MAGLAAVRELRQQGPRCNGAGAEQRRWRIGCTTRGTTSPTPSTRRSPWRCTRTRIVSPACPPHRLTWHAWFLDVPRS
jgi:hypothetical protein